jgi:hypothetical protein
MRYQWFDHCEQQSMPMHLSALIGQVVVLVVHIHSVSQMSHNREHSMNHLEYLIRNVDDDAMLIEQW